MSTHAPLTALQRRRLDRILRLVRMLRTEREVAELRQALGKRLEAIQQGVARASPGRPRVVLLPDQAEALAKGLRKGLSVRALAKKLGVAHATLARMVRRGDHGDMRPRVGGKWQRAKRRAELGRTTGIDLDSVERRAVYRAALEDKLRAAAQWKERIENSLKDLEAAEAALMHAKSPERRKRLRDLGIDLDALLQEEGGPEDES